MLAAVLVIPWLVDESPQSLPSWCFSKSLHGLPATCLSLCLFSFYKDTSHTGSRSHSTPVCLITNLIISAKTPRPHKVIVGGSRRTTILGHTPQPSTCTKQGSLNGWMACGPQTGEGGSNEKAREKWRLWNFACLAGFPRDPEGALNRNVRTR